MADLLCAEDLVAGSVHDLGSYDVGLEEILQFAAHWDPQVFHVDRAAAESGFFGGVIASGVHTVAIYQRLSVLGAYRHWAVIAGRRVTSEFPAPVRPGTLTGSLTIQQVTPTRTDRSLVTTRGALTGPDDEIVLLITVEAYVRRRLDAPTGS